MSFGRAAAVAALALLGACGSGAEDQAEQGNLQAGGEPRTIDVPQTVTAVAPGTTPMAERVAVIGFLNKRNGISRDLPLKPGQAVRIGDAIVRLRACETTAPWESETLTGAFVQLDVERPDGRLQRVFSGWLYKESPSLNVVEHPVYDVWPKSCAMTYPAGPPVPDVPVASSSRSSARNSGSAAAARSRPRAAEPGAAAEPAPAPAEPPPSAADSNAI